MKKTKINLLLNKEDYRKVENFFHWIRISAAILTLILMAILTYFSIVFIKQNKMINSLLEEKRLVLESLKNRENEEAKLIYLEKKYRALNEYLKDDAFFYPYYNLLNSALSESTQSAQLKLFSINKNREVDFAVNFNNFSHVKSFLKFVESEKFIKNFENIVLKNFAINTAATDEKENYELTFTGRFIPINENKN
ncbi:MAG: hypothetical protein ACK4FL_00510 [Microgenomates group bacterium]